MSDPKPEIELPADGTCARCGGDMHDQCLDPDGAYCDDCYIASDDWVDEEWDDEE
jgi:hypothetical protein